MHLERRIPDDCLFWIWRSSEYCAEGRLFLSIRAENMIHEFPGSL